MSGQWHLNSARKHVKGVHKQQYINDIENIKIRDCKNQKIIKEILEGKKILTIILVKITLNSV